MYVPRTRSSRQCVPYYAGFRLQGAAVYLLCEGSMTPLLKQMTDKNGQLRPFEILLRTNTIGANATKTALIGIRLN